MHAESDGSNDRVVDQEAISSLSLEGPFGSIFMSVRLESEAQSHQRPHLFLVQRQTFINLRCAIELTCWIVAFGMTAHKGFSQHEPMCKLLPKRKRSSPLLDQNI